MNRRVIKISFFILFFAVTCFGEEKNVTVGYFKNKSSIYIKDSRDTTEDISGKILSSFILEYLSGCPYIKISKPASLLEKVILPLSISYDKLLLPEHHKVVAEKLSTDYLLLGEIEDFSTKRRVNLKIYFWKVKTTSSAKITSYLINVKTGVLERVDTSKISFSSKDNFFSSGQKNREKHILKIFQMYAQEISEKIKEHLKPSSVAQIYEISSEQVIQKPTDESEKKVDAIQIKYRDGVEEKSNGEINWKKGRIYAYGEALYLKEIEDVSSRHEIARKSSLFSSYKNLREIIYGIKVGGVSIGEKCEKNPNIQKEIDKIIYSSRIIRERRKEDNIYELVVEVSISNLQKIFPDIYIESN